MRRPSFKRWIRRACSDIAQTKTFNFTNLVALAQSTPKRKRDTVDRARLAAALHLYALTNNCMERLREFTWDASFLDKQARVESALGARDIERLALRGTPLLTLPVEYRDILQDFHESYHTPELLAEEKLAMQEQAREMQIKYAIASADIAKATNIAAPNVVAFLKHADVGRVTVDGAKNIVEYLESMVSRLQ